MASAKPPRRTPAGATARKFVKASILVDVELHARWSAAASLRGMDRSAFAVEALRTACKGIVVIDRSRSGKDHVDPSGEVDRPAA
jgi:hypothetical protein